MAPEVRDIRPRRPILEGILSRVFPSVIHRRNKAVVRRIYEAFNTGNTEIIDGLIHPDVLDLSQCPGIEPGFAGMKQQITMLHEQFPDVRFEEVETIAEGDRVISRWRMIGTNTGPIFRRQPTGKRIVHEGTEFVRLKDGKIVEHRDTADVLEFLDKLGVLDMEMLQFLEEIRFRPIP